MASAARQITPAPYQAAVPENRDNEFFRAAARKTRRRLNSHSRSNDKKQGAVGFSFVQGVAIFPGRA
jgi:hypothetical protein